MKEKIKNILEAKYQVNPIQIERAINEKQYMAISFDVFDTLIKRNVKTPSDVFVILSSRYYAHFHKRKDIKRLRIYAEKIANEKSKKEDVTLDEIYASMLEVSVQEKKWLQREEISLEKKLCQRNQDIWPIYQKCLHRGIKIIITTDMYLPSSVIKEILHSAGYSDWSSFYLSSEQNARKSSGNLFSILLQREKLKPNELIHIGDALKGDFLIPRKLGIQSILLRRDNPNTVFFNKNQKSIQYNIISSFISNNMSHSYSYYENIGYEVVGPILYGYCKWLKEKLEEEKISKVFFLAREGFLLDRAFSLFDINNIEHRVIRVSRHATATPLLYTANSLHEVLNKITITRAEFTIGNLLDSCEIDKMEGSKILNENGFKVTNIIDNLDEKNKDRLFDLFRDVIKSVSLEQNKAIHGYLQQYGFEGKVAVCDVGWHGTIQNALQEIFPDMIIKGYYIGKKEKNGKKKSQSEAFLFDEPFYHHDIEKEIMSAPDLFEIFFLSTDGSARSYKVINGEYVCLQKEPEQTEEIASQIIALQNAALTFVKDFYVFNEALKMRVAPKACEAAYSKLVNPPSNQTVDELRMFHFLNVESHSMVASHSLGYYMVHPKVFKNEFLNNGSKSIFLKSVMKLPLPYADIIDKLRRFDK